MCRGCRRIVPAKVFFRDEQVWQQSLCPDCRNESALIAAYKNWFLTKVLRTMPDKSPLLGAKLPKHGCPYDCGPCTWHASSCQHLFVAVTNVCNIRSPICFTYNRSEGAYYMSAEEMSRIVDLIIESSGEVDLINITGGEPTLHPDIINIIRSCKRPQIRRVTITSNGILLAENYHLCQRLAEEDVYINLGLDAFDRDTSELLYGRDVTEIKLKAIDNLTRAGVKMTLLYMMLGGVNENSAGRILNLMRQNDNILSITVQTMTYTGQGNGSFKRTKHIPVDLAAKKICEQSDGMLEFADFVSHPSAHPLCYLVGCISKERTAKSAVKTIYVHSYMDEDTFDCSRAMLCTDLVSSEPGRFIPACTYNLFYRMKDERFYI